MDTDTETTALCSSSSRQASPPGTPTPEADTTLLKQKPEKLLAELDRSGPPPVPGAPRRRGSMPVPYKHQLRRGQAVDELDWPPQASSSGSSESLGSGDAGSTQKDGVFKVMLLGESGVGKSTLAGTFGGLQGDSAHEMENSEDTYERRIMVDKEEVTLIVYDIWEQGDAGGWLQDHCLQTGDAFLIVFSVTDRRSFSKVPETLLRLRAGRPHHDLPVILVGNKSDLARSREVSLEGVYPEPIVYLKSQEMTFQALPPREAFYSSLVYDRMHLVPGLGNSPTTQPLGKKAKRFLANLVPRNAKFFKQRSRSCHDLSVL
ncbi:GTP-binding protein REM 2 [Cricetulus griseus]|uniref:GTP-binding protein REM 2 n=1 Tax=Cricetulus griseus TaxID=10029 RepID=G3HRD2_CRIGR|nr:GTP-binding protein REM 2 [Cricetulus griseus]